jgi:hypothetical protein
MNNNEIIAATETAYELVETYSRDLQDFIDNLRGEANSVSVTLRNMNTHWDGVLYDDFAKNINAKLSKIEAALSRGESLRETLDQSAAELKIAIEVLSSASDT